MYGLILTIKMVDFNKCKPTNKFLQHSTFILRSNHSPKICAIVTSQLCQVTAPCVVHVTTNVKVIISHDFT
jgi:hypothetical protein